MSRLLQNRRQAARALVAVRMPWLRQSWVGREALRALGVAAGARRALGGFNPVLLPTLLIGVALLAATVLAWLGLRAWQGAVVEANPRVVVLETSTPTSPVSTLDRIYLSTRIANPDARRLEDLAVAMSVVADDGRVVLETRQRGIALDANDSRSIYWAWRVPDQTAAGAYQVKVVVTDGEGQVLGTSEGAPATLLIRER